MNRRELLKVVAALPLAQTAFSNSAFAQAAYPSRNITMIVPFPPGGQADLAARPVAQALERILGKPVIVDNRAGGGGGSVGNAQAARAEAQKGELVARHSDHISQGLYPEKGLQERGIGGVYFLAKYGLELLGQLHGAMHTDCHDHQVIEL